MIQNGPICRLERNSIHVTQSEPKVSRGTRIPKTEVPDLAERLLPWETRSGPQFITSSHSRLTTALFWNKWNKPQDLTQALRSCVTGQVPSNITPLTRTPTIMVPDRQLETLIQLPIADVIPAKRPVTQYPIKPTPFPPLIPQFNQSHDFYHQLPHQTTLRKSPPRCYPSVPSSQQPVSSAPTRNPPPPPEPPKPPVSNPAQRIIQSTKTMS